MRPVIQQLLKQVETGGQEEKLSCLLGIGDYLEHPHPHEDGYIETVQQLINLLNRENDAQVRKLFFRNISIAYMYSIDLSEVTFDPLINGLDKKDPVFISNVLYLLSMTYKAKYKEVISKYISHPDEQVKKEALDALTYLP